jgi:hypothetical protein
MFLSSSAAMPTDDGHRSQSQSLQSAQPKPKYPAVLRLDRSVHLVGTQKEPTLIAQMILERGRLPVRDSPNWGELTVSTESFCSKIA